MSWIPWIVMIGCWIGWIVIMGVFLLSPTPPPAPACLASHRELIVTEKLCKDGFCPVPIVVTVCDKAALTIPRGVR